MDPKRPVVKWFVTELLPPGYVLPFEDTLVQAAAEGIGGMSLASPILAGLMALADERAGYAHGFANPLFYANATTFTDITSVKTAVARANYVNGVDATDGIVHRLRTFDDYSGSPTQSTQVGWDNVTGLGTPNAAFLNTFGQ